MFVNYFGGEVVLNDVDVFGVRFLNNFMFEIVPESSKFEDSKFNKNQIGLHHFALQLENKVAVDNVYKQLIDMNIVILDEPKFYPEYENGYYAVFW